ncbi:AMP-binding protein [Geotalea toluenoxydans]|uniref:AMP-binding protein n=1 Tax=Geotalea toluenoxydans TaxID=421624 RepID=UPI0024369295|nr:AMP-binding protein [Geotalea toluenoxydans]
MLRQIERFRPASVVASPAFLERIATACLKSNRTVAGFRYVFTGGAPVFPDHLERFTATFADAKVVAVYGSTEAEPIAHIAAQELTNKDKAAMSAGAGLLTGVPVDEICLRVITPSGARRWGYWMGRPSPASACRQGKRAKSSSAADMC